MGILIESFSDVKIIKENAGDKPKYIIDGVFAQANKMLKNPHIYPRALMENVKSFFETNFIEKGIAWGELGHRDGLDLKESNIVLHVDKLEWDKDNLLGRATILDNDNGKQYLSMMEAGKPGVSTRGGGSVKHQIVQNDYMTLYWDAVGRPSADSVMRMVTENMDTLDISEIDYDMFKKIINNDKDKAKVIKENIVNWFDQTMNKYKI